MPNHFLSQVTADRCRLTVERTGQLLASDAEIARDSTSRKRGLLGRDSLARGAALIIAPCQGVHTFGMQFAIDIVAVDREGRVVKSLRRVRPRRIALAWSAFAFIELPAGALDDLAVLNGDRIVAMTKGADSSTISQLTQ